MLKYIIDNHQLLLKLIKVPIISKFFTQNIETFDNIDSLDVHDKLIRYFRYGDATGKETYFGRFDDLDKHIMKHLRNNMSFHDIGCSSGVTSLDLLEKCKKSKIKLNLTISDKYTKLYFTGTFFRKIYDTSRNLKQIYIGRLLLDKNISPLFFLSKFLFYPFSMLISKNLDLSNFRQISLMIPTIKVLHDSNDLEIVDYDIFSTPTRKFNFVRCMNLLNRSYFSNDLIILGLRNLIQSLSQNGLLLIGRTDTNNINNASLIKKVDDHLVVLNHFSGGVEIFDLIQENFKVTNYGI